MSVRRFVVIGGLTVLIAMGAQPSFALWFGNPGQSSLSSRPAVSFAADAAAMKLSRLNGNGVSADFDSERFYVQMENGLGRYVRGFVRAMPGAGLLHYEGLSFNPHLWGVGGGVQVCTPATANGVTLGVIGTLDAVAGARRSGGGGLIRGFDYLGGGRRNYTTWRSASIAAGPSWKASDKVSLYTGLSYTRDRINLYFEDFGVQRFRNTETVGGFVGTDLSLDDHWRLGAEGRVGSERALSLSLAYQFDGSL